MAYDQAKLISDVRICLGGISEPKLPESIIIHFGDLHDSNPDFTGDYPQIFWRTTLDCVQYLIANTATSSSSNKAGVKEKVGNVTKEETFTSTANVIGGYRDLYDYLLNNPDKFGVVLTNSPSVVLINGVNQAEVDKYRNNTETTSIYNPLSATAFPKVSGVTWRRSNTTSGRR